jgi:PAS domain-containing protein
MSATSPLPADGHDAAPDPVTTAPPSATAVEPRPGTIGVFEVDRQGQVRTADAAFAAIVGRERAELAGVALADLLAPAHRDRCVLPAAGGDITGWRARVGSDQIVRFQLNALEDEPDRVLGIALEEGRAAPADWENADADVRYAKLLRNIDDVITVCDANGVILKNLGHFEELLGWRRRTGKAGSSRVRHPDEVDDARRSSPASGDAWRSGDPAVPHRHRDGRWRPSSRRSTCRHRRAAIIIISRNVTLQRQNAALHRRRPRCRSSSRAERSSISRRAISPDGRG